MDKPVIVNTLKFMGLGLVMGCLHAGMVVAAPAERNPAGPSHEGIGSDQSHVTVQDIQRQIDTCPPNGTVTIPPGRYELKSSLVLKDNMTLRGSGSETVLTNCKIVHTRLAAQPSAKSRSITVEDPTGFEAGMGIYISSKVDPADSIDRKWWNAWRSTWAEILAIQGNTIHLSKGIKQKYYVPESVVTNHFSAVLIPETVHNVRIENLTIDGNREETDFEYSDFTIAGIFTEWGTRDILVRDVLIKEWPCDGFSMQNGTNITVINCIAHDNGGHGFHPGTSIKQAVFDSLQAYRNKVDGLFFCADVKNLTLSNSRFWDNGRHGIGELGGGKWPDKNNQVISNVCWNNEKSGIYCIEASDCTLLKNKCYDNSREAPGLHADIHIEKCSNMLLINNEYGTLKNISNQRTYIHPSPD